MSNPILPPSVNFHILNACNYDCGFCFAVFDDSAEYLGKGQLPLESQLAIVRQVASAGVEKITFAGGEPTLSRHLPELLAESKRLGLVTMVVTNGSRLDVVGERIYPHLDWLVLSVDSAVESTNVASGRAQKGTALMPAEYVALADHARERGVRIKLNTVVHRLNVGESMVDFVELLRPERWKVFQVLPVDDQNGDRIDEFRIDDNDFNEWLVRHAVVSEYGVELVSEANDEMRGTYAMIDPAGRFYDSSAGFHAYSEPILAVGIEEAFAQVTFAPDGYEDRGAIYDWDVAETPQFIALAGVSGSGKDTVAQQLVKQGYRRIAIADPLKRAARDLWQLDDEQLWGELRNVVDERWDTTPRRLYQQLGDAIRAVDPEVWIRAWTREVLSALETGEHVVCTDIRTMAELESAGDLGAFTVLIERPGAGAPAVAGQHSTEREVWNFVASQFDATIRNDGNLGDLATKVRNVLRDWRKPRPARLSFALESSPIHVSFRRDLRFTDHARERMDERGFTEDEVHYIVDHGRRSSGEGGARLYEMSEPITFRELIEVVVVVDPHEDLVVTVYRKGARPLSTQASRVERSGFTFRDAVEHGSSSK